MGNRFLSIFGCREECCCKCPSSLSFSGHVGGFLLGVDLGMELLCDRYLSSAPVEVN